jgi:hypothetical protein
MRDGSNISPLVPLQTNVFDFVGSSTGPSRSLHQTAQPRLEVEPQAEGSNSFWDALNGIGSTLGNAFNSVVEAVAINEIDRQRNSVERRVDTRGNPQDQPQGGTVELASPSIFENKNVMYAVGIGAAVLVGIALLR